MTLVRSIWSRIDKFLAAILLTVALATVMPARGEAAVAVGWLTDAAIALLFFMHGAKLSPEVAASWRAALAAARDGVPEHIRVVSVARDFRALARPGFAPRAAVGRGDLAHRAALDGAVLDRFHVGGRRQRAGGAVQRLCLEFARRFPDAPDRRLPADPARPRHLRALGSCHRRAASAALRRRSTVAAMDRRLISRAIRARSRAWITARSC